MTKLFFFLILGCSSCYALAPPPVNFTYEEIEIPQGTIILQFDGEKMTATMKKKTPLYQQILLVFGLMFYTSLIIPVLALKYGFLKVLVGFYILTWIGILITVILKRIIRNERFRKTK